MVLALEVGVGDGVGGVHVEVGDDSVGVGVLKSVLMWVMVLALATLTFPC